MKKATVMRKWGVLAIASSLILLAYLMQYQASALAYQLVPKFGLNAVDLSNLMFAPFLIAAVLGIPFGALADRWGVRYVVGVALIASLVGAVGRVLAPSYEILLGSTVMMGFAPAALNANLMKLIGAWFMEKSSVAIGIYYACSGLGASAAMLTATLFPSAQAAFAGSATLLAVFFVLWWIVVRESPCGANRGAVTASLSCAGAAARVGSVWCIALITGFGLASKTAYLNFMPQALGATLSPDQANAMAAFVTYGGVIGCVVGPLLCARQKHPKAFIVGCAIIAAALMFASVAFLSSPSAALFFFVGLSTSVTAPIVEAIPCVLPALKSCMGSAGGIIGSVSLVMSYVLPLAITVLANGVFAFMVLLVGVCYVLAIPFMMLLPGINPDELREASF